MKDELIKFETAKLAKEKGFDEFCDWVFETESEIRRLNYFEGNGNGFVKNSEIDKDYDSFIIALPTQSLLQRWLREAHDINVNIRHWINQPTSNGGVIKNCYNYDIWLVDECFNVYYTYEEALEVGLFEALKLINNENRR